MPFLRYFGIVLSLCVCNLASAKPNDYYEHCIAQHEFMNNGVVQACSQEAIDLYTQEITQYLKKLKAAGIRANDLTKYHNILKAHTLWEKYVEVECDNAGQYIGSPMYGYCPMQYYQERSARLAEYTD